MTSPPKKTLEDHEAWRLRSEKREEQLQQVRAQRRRVASGIALFGASVPGGKVQTTLDVFHCESLQKLEITCFDII